VLGFHSLKGGKTMAKKEKRMCKWKENDLSEKFDKFTAIVSNPKFVCKKCLRVADKKKLLHKPASLK
jgi:16S rRNA G1207 methylase RsmC